MFQHSDVGADDQQRTVSKGICERRDNEVVLVSRRSLDEIETNIRNDDYAAQRGSRRRIEYDSAKRNREKTAGIVPICSVLAGEVICL